MQDCRDCQTFDHCRRCYAARRLNFKNGLLIVLAVAALCGLLALLFGDPGDRLREARDARAAAQSREEGLLRDLARDMGGVNH